MTDITQRLRDLACGGSNWNNTLTDAADEIERLRALAAPSVPSVPVATVGDLIIQVRERVMARGIKNGAPLYLAAPAAPDAQKGAANGTV